MVKIIHADLKYEKGSPVFLEKGQTFIPVNEDNANIFYLQTKARGAFREEDLELRTSNGLKINDNEGTRGERKLNELILTEESASLESFSLLNKLILTEDCASLEPRSLHVDIDRRLWLPGIVYVVEQVVINWRLCPLGIVYVVE